MAPTLYWEAVLSAVDLTKSLKVTGHTPFHTLAEMEGAQDVGEEEMLTQVQAIKSAGFVNVDAISSKKGGRTALQIAAQRRKVGLVRALVRAEADVNMRSRDGWSTLSYAAEGGHPAIVHFLIEWGADVMHSLALHEAARVCAPGSSETIQILLDAGEDPNERNGNKRQLTPAQLCCRNTGGSTAERAAVLSTLLAGGAEVGLVSTEGATLLHEAADSGLAESIRVLLEHGLSADVRDSNQETPLHHAASCRENEGGGLECVQALVRGGADSSAVGASGVTPVLKAVGYANLSVTEALIDAGASVTAKEARNDITALHIAAALGNIKLAYLLIEAGADICALTEDGCSPLTACAATCTQAGYIPIMRSSVKTMRGDRAQRQQVAKLLLKLGAPLDEKFLGTAMTSGWANLIAEAYAKASEKAAEAIDRLGTVAHHHSSTDSAGDALNRSVVKIRLINEEQQEAKDDEQHANEYIISLSLVEKLIPQALSADQGGQEAGERKRQRTGGRGGSHASATGSLLRLLLDPESAGFQGNDVGGGVRTAGCFGGREIELRHDGSDFTEEGFQAVVDLCTTGSIEDFLTRGGGGRRRVSGSGKREGLDHEEGCEGATRLRLFDAGRAESALQAAEFFGLEQMQQQVQSIASEYGFEVGA